MTDEKIKELAKLECTKLLKSEKGYNGLSFQEFWVEGMRYGLAEGRKEKWHDLRKDPNDLPKREELSDQSIMVLNQNGYNVRYDFSLKYWHFLNDDEATVIEWCELPKFEE